MSEATRSLSLVHHYRGTAVLISTPPHCTHRSPWQVHAFLAQADTDTVAIVDPAVYTKNRAFRLVGSAKIGAPNHLTLAAPAALVAAPFEEQFKVRQLRPTIISDLIWGVVWCDVV